MERKATGEGLSALASAYPKRVAVVGGGASGLMAAYAAAKNGHRVLLLEKNEKLGKKLYITGKGRCNLTNDCPPEEFLQNVVHGERFLRGTAYRFPASATMAFMEEHGLALKTERGNRVFPASDHASDVTKTLERACRDVGVGIELNCEVKEIVPLLPSGGRGTASLLPPDEKCADSLLSSGGKGAVPLLLPDGRGAASLLPPDGKAEGSSLLPPPCVKGEGRVGDTPPFLLITSHGEMSFDAVIVATGGLSYPSTGSTGDGYKFALKAGHTVAPCVPSLVGIEADGVSEAQGISVKNAVLTAQKGGKTLFSELGELLFTHYGVSGPLVLSLSSKINRLPLSEVSVTLDFKPALDEKKLDERLLRDFAARGKEQLKSVMRGLLPAGLVFLVLREAKLDPEKRANSLSKEERGKLLRALKEFPVRLTKLRGFSEAVVTSGGVDLKEIDPVTMESRKIRGLHFCGEVLDCDAFTGGFNLQIAFSTGFMAGNGIK